MDDNGLNIADILQNEKIDASVTIGFAPYQMVELIRKKEPVTIIIASSAAIISIAFAISKVLSTFYQRPKVVKLYEPIELRDAKGNIIKDKEGIPIFKKIERYEILQPKLQEMQQAKISINSTNGVVIQISSDLDSRSQQ